MISGLAFTFVLLPCIAACVFATVLRDWRLVAAAVFGVFGFMALYQYMSEPVRLIIWPILFGVLASAIGLFPYVLWRPNSDVWGRMIAAVVPTFIITFMILILEFSRR